MARFPGYLVIGHITKDLMPDGSYLPGGTASYSALAARRLGLDVGVLTSAGADVRPFANDDGIAVCSLASVTTTLFENVATGSGRRQFLRATADVIPLSALPPEWRCPRIVHLGPVAQEVDPAFAQAFPDAFVGVTPQGWLRQWNEIGTVSFSQWADASRLLPCVDAVVISPEDVDGDLRRVERYAQWASVLVLTVGERGAVVYEAGRKQRIPAYEAREVDATGAGDVFAAAFFSEYSTSGNAIAAGRFANAAASFVVEGLGASSIPSREDVLERLARGRVRP